MLAGSNDPFDPEKQLDWFAGFLEGFKTFKYQQEFHDRAEGITIGLCDWFLDWEEIQSWMSEQMYSILWLTGSPGLGKTSLAVTFINSYDTILRRSGKENSHAAIYSFCVPQQNDTASTVICIAIHQLLQRIHGHEQTDLMKIAKKCGLYITPTAGVAIEERQRSARPEFLWDYFRKLVQLSNLKTVYLILDGLDECDPKNQEKLSALLAQGEPNLRVLLISRPLEHLIFGASMSKLVTQGILKVVDLHDKDSDINLAIAQFIDTELYRIAQARGYTDARRDLAISRLKKRASSLFLPVALVFKQLSASLSSQLEPILDETIDRLDALTEVYQTLLSRIPSQVLSKASTMLMYLLHSYQPLRVEELAYLCAKEYPAESSAQETVTYKALRADLRLLGPILRVRTVDDTVQFFHSSAKTFIVESSSSQSTLATWQSSIPARPSCHHELAMACLQTIYKARRSIQSDGPLPWDNNRHAKEFAFLSRHIFLSYAQRFWAIHVKQAYYYGSKINNFDFSSISREFFRLSQIFLTETKRFADGSAKLHFFFRFFLSVNRDTIGLSSNLMALRADRNTAELRIRGSIDPLLFYAHFGNAQLFADFRRRNQKQQSLVLSSKDVHYTIGTVLTFAVRSGDLDLLKGIMESYEVLDLESPLLCRILKVAVESGQQEMVQFIQEKRKTDIRELENALIEAVRQGNMETAKLLLDDSYWSPEVTDILGHNLLHSIASGSRIEDETMFIEIWKLLEDHGLDINARDKLGSTVLHHLSWNRTLGTVDLLRKMIDDDADPTIKNDLGELPLHFAAARLKFEAFEYLLSETERSSQLEADNHESSSMAIVQASGNGSISRFLSKGRSTPLHWVAHRNESGDVDHVVRIIKCLLSRGYQLTDATRSGRTALSLALTNVRSFSNLCLAATRMEGIDTFETAAVRYDFREGRCAIFCPACMIQFGIGNVRSHANLRGGNMAFVVYSATRFSPGYNCEHWGTLSSEVIRVETREANTLLALGTSMG
ncbi:hypothetical protein WAI453_007735 [Rhynchosporium graminicola]